MILQALHIPDNSFRCAVFNSQLCTLRGIFLASYSSSSISGILIRIDTESTTKKSAPRTSHSKHLPMTMTGHLLWPQPFRKCVVSSFGAKKRIDIPSSLLHPCLSPFAPVSHQQFRTDFPGFSHPIFSPIPVIYPAIFNTEICAYMRQTLSGNAVSALHMSIIMYIHGMHSCQHVTAVSIKRPNSQFLVLNLQVVKCHLFCLKIGWWIALEHCCFLHPQLTTNHEILK